MSAQMLLLAILSVFSATVAGFLSPRATCASLGAGWTDVASAFTLAAYSSATDTSTPLYIVNVNVVPHTAYHVISPWNNKTYASYGFTTLTMSAGIIHVLSPNNPQFNTISIGTAKIDGQTLPAPSPGPWPAFSTNTPNSPPSDQYCVVPSTVGPPLLALFGRTDLFAICTSTFPTPAGTIPAVVYDPSTVIGPNQPGNYDGSSCQAVTLQVIQ